MMLRFLTDMDVERFIVIWTGEERFLCKQGFKLVKGILFFLLPWDITFLANQFGKRSKYV